MLKDFYDSVEERCLHGLSYLPQEPSVFKDLTVEENILSILEIRKNLNFKDRKRKLNFLLKEFNLEKIKKNKGSNLSGGERA